MQELLQTLSPMAQGLVKGAPAMRKTAAAGRMPLRPSEMLIVLTALASDSDPEIAQLAYASFQKQPRPAIEGLLHDRNTHGALLHMVAVAFYQDAALLQAVLLHKQTPDPTFAWLASFLQGEWLEIIARNQERQTRFPPLVPSLLQNPGLPQGLRALTAEFALRQGLETGLSSHELRALLSAELIAELLERQPLASPAPGASPSSSDPSAVDPQEADTSTDPGALDAPLPSSASDNPSASGAILSAALASEEDIPEEYTVEDPSAPPEDSPEAEKKRLTLQQQVLTWTTSQKIKAAIKGNKQMRDILIRESNKLVATAVLQNAGLSDSEVVKIANSRNVIEDVIRTILRNRDWMKSYQIRLALIKNPKCPQPDALRMMSLLRDHDLKLVASSKSVPSNISSEANKMVKARVTKQSK